MTIKEKILLYLDYKGLVKSDFYKAVDIAPSNFKGSNKTSELGSDKLVKILTLYPDLSPDWILFDKGEMICDSQNNISDTPITIEDKLLSLIQEKDNIIREQAEEIGQLRERISQLQREKGKTASDALTSDIANAG